jgi:hypothetical protein
MVRSCCSVIVKTKNTLLFNKYPIGEETMLNRYLILITIMIIFSVVLSCSGTTPAHEQSLLERNWGRSLESMRYMQMVDPEAGKNLDPVEGLDGN